ncbi:MAG: GAF domain-containing protein [Candidatus Latescibacterota bacterium]
MDDEDKSREQLINELAALRHRNAELEVSEADRKRTEEALQETEKRFRWLAENTRDIIFRYWFTPTQGFDYVSPAATAITGYTPEEYYADPWLGLKLVHPDDRTMLEKWFQGEGISETPTALRWVHKNGTTIWIEQRNMPVYDESGNLAAVDGIVCDVTGHEQAKDSVRREAARLRALARIGARLNAELNLNALVNSVCEESARAFDVPVASVLLYEPSRDVFLPAATFGLPLEEHERCTPVPRALYDGCVQKMGPLIVVPDVQATPHLPDLDLYAQHNIRTVVAASLIREDELIGLLAICTRGEPRAFGDDELILLQGLADRAALAVTNARLFEEVRAGRERLRALSNRLVEVQEVERRHLARELHDEIGQVLTGLKLALEMSGRIAEDAIRDEPLSLVNQLLRQVRDLSLDLRPAMLDDLGLLPALLWQFERYTAQTHIRVRFNHSGLEKRRFAGQWETASYRIVQEALTNVARHAEVDEVAVRVWTTHDALCMDVQDQGTGFDPEATLSGASGGLIGMRERVVLLGGHLKVASTPGAGTHLAAVLPLGKATLKGRKGHRT